MRKLQGGTDDPARERAGEMPNPELRDGSAPLPMYGTETDGRAAELEDGHAVLGMSAVWHKRELREYKTVGSSALK